MMKKRALLVLSIEERVRLQRLRGNSPDEIRLRNSLPQGKNPRIPPTGAARTSDHTFCRSGAPELALHTAREKGCTFKILTPPQHNAADLLLESSLSDEGLHKGPRDPAARRRPSCRRRWVDT